MSARPPREALEATGAERRRQTGSTWPSPGACFRRQWGAREVPQAAAHTEASGRLELVPSPSVDCLDGSVRRALMFDHAASTPPLQGVVDAVAAFLPWYGSVQRGAGRPSEVSTAAVTGARRAVLEFVRAREDQVVIFVRNATEAINLFAAVLPPGSRVLSSPYEHHANMLPWRLRHEVELLPFVAGPAELFDATERALVAARGSIDLVAVTGASNVTGETWPLGALAELAHRHGAELFVDAAQLAPHRPIDISAAGIDHLALSGHKLYAPFGAGALVARRGRLDRSTPLLQGGGAVDAVGVRDLRWADSPRRHEAGTPNLVGVVALGAACDLLASASMWRIAADERPLGERLRAGLDATEGVRRLHSWPDGSTDVVGTTTFVVDGWSSNLIASALAAEHAISVRSGRFCAHPLVDELTAGVGRKDGRAVRASVGLASSADDVETFLTALAELIQHGPRFTYRDDPEAGRPVPAHDARAWPTLPIRLGDQARRHTPAHEQAPGRRSRGGV
jgi:selenocysteine lyase/cysteine desulfurase